MTKNRIAKIAALTVGMTFALSLSVNTASAQATVADLQAQINQLMAQLAALQGGTPTGSAVQFNTNLTVGSRGADVTALQQFLVSKGHLQMPVGVAYGYFGPVTKSAVARWQAANGITPAVGYFGPISRARIATQVGGGTVTPGTCPVGYTCAPTGGGVITTPGVEGTITVTRAPSPASGTKVYEGEDRKSVLGIEIEAKTSDMRIERIKLDLDETGDTATSDSAFYNKFADKIYILDGSTILASMDLNSSTVVEESNEITITLAGMSYVVPKGTKKTLTVALDAKASWDTTYDNDTWTVGVAAEGVRSIDGAGVNQYGPTTAFSNSVTSSADLADSATLSISTHGDTPDTQDVVCTSGADEDECDELEMLKFSAKAEDDDVTITDLTLDITQTGATASTTVAYLYDGSTLVGSETVLHDDGASAVTFDDIDWVVSEGTTKVFTVKLDITDTDATSNSWVVDFDTADIVAENSRGDGITESGSATGNSIGVRKIGPIVSLVSKSITTSGVAQSDTSTNLSTSTLTATFNVKIKAVGDDLVLGTVASGSPLFASSTASFKVYRNGSYDGTISAGATSTSYSIPSECSTSGVGSNSCMLAEGEEVTIPVTFQIIGRNVGGVSLTRGSVYAVGFEGLTYDVDGGSQDQTTTFMAGDTDWRTSDVSFP